MSVACFFTFAAGMEERAKVTWHHAKDIVIQVESETFHCNECHKEISVDSDMNLEVHLRVRHFICPQCRLQCTSENDVRKHYVLRHVARMMSKR